MACSTDYEETDHDVEYMPQESEDSEAYEYDSDIATEASSDEETPENEESPDIMDTESPLYNDWAVRTFNPNCREPEEHVGYPHTRPI